MHLVKAGSAGRWCPMFGEVSMGPGRKYWQPTSRFMAPACWLVLASAAALWFTYGYETTLPDLTCICGTYCEMWYSCFWSSHIAIADCRHLLLNSRNSCMMRRMYIVHCIGADGSVRMFDLRHLEHSTIIYEDPQHQPLLRLAWNKQDPNYLATMAMDALEVGLHDSSVYFIHFLLYVSVHLSCCMLWNICMYVVETLLCYLVGLWKLLFSYSIFPSELLLLLMLSMFI